MESIYLSTVLFVKEVDSFCDVKCYPDCAKGFQCYLSSTSKHWEHWRNAVDENQGEANTLVYSGIILKNNCTLLKEFSIILCCHITL